MKKGSFYFSVDNSEYATVILGGSNHNSTTLNYENVDDVIVKFAEPEYGLIGYTNVKFIKVSTEYFGDLFNVNLYNSNVVIDKYDSLLKIYIFKNKNVTEEKKK